MAIEKNYPSNPDAVIYAAIHYMQMWVDLQKECDKTNLDQMAKSLSEWMKNKRLMAPVQISLSCNVNDPVLGVYVA